MRKSKTSESDDKLIFHILKTYFQVDYAFKNSINLSLFSLFGISLNFFIL